MWANVAKSLNCIVAMVDRLQERDHLPQEVTSEGSTDNTKNTGTYKHTFTHTESHDTIHTQTHPPPPPPPPPRTPPPPPPPAVPPPAGVGGAGAGGRGPETLLQKRAGLRLPEGGSFRQREAVGSRLHHYDERSDGESDSPEKEAEFAPYPRADSCDQDEEVDTAVMDGRERSSSQEGDAAGGEPDGGGGGRRGEIGRAHV